MLVCLFSYILVAQKAPFPKEVLMGYWSGAMIKSGNSIQTLNAEFYAEGDSLMVRTSIPDWIYYPAKESVVKRSDKAFSFATFYGEARLMLDQDYLEMVGKLSVGDVSLHLKKTLKPPVIAIGERRFSLNNEGAAVTGTLFYPNAISTAMACAILVHGRGCAGQENLTNRARKLAEYGICTLVYDKRGSDPSAFPCQASTHDLNVSDVRKLVETAAGFSQVDPSKIGLISYSAGVWIGAEVLNSSSVPIAFFISLVGPSTSVYQQQLDGMEAFLKSSSEVEEQVLKDAQRYTQLLFAESMHEEAFLEMEKLLNGPTAKAWKPWLEDDDQITSAEDFHKLWVQRFSYDPSRDLAHYPGPYLAVYGESDLVVPYQKQLNHLDAIMEEAGKTNYETRLVLSADHGLEHGGQQRKLLQADGGNLNYFKFDRVAFGSMHYLIDFLEKEGMLQQ
jgi:fermentation-respiration switch protein FrsA (DUF1100 family)